ncbi:hypothetical protein [Methylobacterium planeticum]|uniref:Uncharacterized protein n=1 Tax=Methylobacterium planeticum TaxID=2615211 RepID=A0A6N6MYD3_9HYPH|nr:hypothetical protein [Methylobacterium planeticum]KAB1076063.1 hypothetical protein F6X51_00540 [Methylobacterium planeticum]
MDIEALERPAALKVWHALPARFSPEHPARFPSLREAIAAAGAFLADPALQPWITTEEGDLLPPVWIRTYLN